MGPWDSPGEHPVKRGRCGGRPSVTGAEAPAQPLVPGRRCLVEPDDLQGLAQALVLRPDPEFARTRARRVAPRSSAPPKASLRALSRTPRQISWGARRMGVLGAVSGMRGLGFRGAGHGQRARRRGRGAHAGGGQPAISRWALVPHSLVQPFVPGWRIVRMRTRMRAAFAITRWIVTGPVYEGEPGHVTASGRAPRPWGGRRAPRRPRGASIPGCRSRRRPRPRRRLLRRRGPASPPAGRPG